MKVSLVVASGPHKGKAIPVPGAQLVIGRAEGCHLRPASPAVSNKHTAVVVRGGKVFVSDLGSTNGTFVNDAQVSGEVEVKAGDRLKVGPLDFTIDVAASTAAGMKPVAPPKPAAAAETANAAALNPTPAEGQPPAADKAAAAKKPAAAPEDEDAAALLLAMGDDDVPEGSTVTDIPTVDPNNPAAPAKSGGAGPGGAPIPTKESSSSAAANLLSKYMKRPTTPPGKGK